MSQVHHFIDKDQFKLRNFNQLNFNKPIIIGSYAAKYDAFGKRKLFNTNQEDFFFKYKIDQVKIGDNLKVNSDQKFDNDLEVFKLHSELDEFLKYILMTKEKFFNQNYLNNKSTENSNLKQQSTLDQHFSQLNLDGKRKLKFDFVALRSLLSVLLRCLYVPEEPFTIEAEKFDDVIYLQLNKEIDQIQKISDHVYAAQKFETLATTKFFNVKPIKDNLEKLNLNKPLIACGSKENCEKDEFNKKLAKIMKHELCFVFNNKITINDKQYSFIYPASMCCFENQFDLNKIPIDSDLIEGVELKINREIIGNPPAALLFNKKKMIKHWCQSKLSNVKKITCAFWNGNNFKINRIKEYTLNELEINGCFDGNACYYQFYEILDFIKKCFELNKNTNLLKFEYKAFSNKIICQHSNIKVVPEFFKAEYLK